MDSAINLFHLFQELRICKENTATYRKLITLKPLFKHTLNKENIGEWKLILSHLMEILTSNQDLGKEWLLLASHAFFLLQSALCDPETLQSCFIHFLDIQSPELFFINKTYKISNLKLFKLIITHGFLQVNKKGVYSNAIMCAMFKVIYPHCIHYTAYSYFAYKTLNTWMNRSIYSDLWQRDTLLIEEQLETIIFSNWHNAISDIPKQNATYIFNMYLKIMIEKYNGFLEYTISCVEKLSWQSEIKYALLAEICDMPECNIAIIASENFLFNLSTSLTKSHLCCVGRRVYVKILNKLSENYWIKIFSNVIKHLIHQWELGQKNNYNAIKSLCKYWLEPTFAKYKNTLLHLWELCKDLKAPFFHSNLQRIACEMYITVPPNSDLLSYIYHKHEVIRLNGFVICCYYCSKTFNNDKIDYFIMLKQFLWYNANVPSVFLRCGITKYFTIFYTNILKNGENFQFNQYIYDIINWLYEYLLDCFEPGSCYQRKILGLKLYKIVLSVTDTYPCKHLSKCMKKDIKKKFTNKKCLLVLLKLIQDNALDVKQAANYIIINYFGKDLLANVEKKVLFDIAIENCNSSKFHEVETGAEFMKTLATWEPFNTEFITNKCKTKSSDINYCEFFLQEAQKQLMQMKEDVLKAIVHNAPFYGVLNAMLKMNFQNDLINCKPPLYLVEKILNFLDDTANFFLSILSSKSATTEYASSFAEMGLAINDTIKTSMIQDDNYDDFVLSPAHKVIISCIWLSLKVTCEIASSIGCSAYSNDTTLHSIKLIATVLTKCRHKGAIETAGVAIGNIVRCICKEDTYDETLKVYVKNLIQDNTMKTLNVTRRGAGFSLMFHKIVSNDNRRGRPLLHFAVQELLAFLESWPKTEFENIESKYDFPLTRHLNFLCTLVTDKELHMQLLPYMERISLICFQYLQSKTWPIRNASLQLFGAVVPRLAGQNVGGRELDYGNGYSINHFITHYPTLAKHISLQFQYFAELPEDSKTMLHEYSNIIHILTLLSKFSVSGCDFIDYLSYTFVTEMKSYFFKLLANPIEHVRILTAKAYAGLTAFSCIKYEMKILQLNISAVKDINTIHGYLLIMTYLRDKFLAEVESINPYNITESAMIIQKEEYSSKNRIQNIVQVWNNKLKTKSNQQICYVIECMLLELLDLKLFSSNIELFEKIILKSSFILHVDKIIPGCYQFIDSLTCLYADYIKHTNTINMRIIDQILRSEYKEQIITFLTHLHHFNPLLKIIMNILLTMIDNSDVVVINAIIKFVVATLKSSSLDYIYEIKLEEIVMNLLEKLDKNNTCVNTLHLKNVLIAIFEKDENIIYETVLKIFNMSCNENEYMRNEAVECLQFLIQRFPKLQSQNKLAIMHCCVIFLKDNIFDTHNSIITNIQNHIMFTLYSTEDISEHDEFIYQQLLYEVVHYTSVSNFSYLNNNLEFIKKFVDLDETDNKQLALIENPFECDGNTLYKEETKFLNILYFYIQCNKKVHCTLKYKGNVKNYIDTSHAIISKYQLVEKSDINLDCLRTILALTDKEYLCEKQKVLIQEYSNSK